MSDAANRSGRGPGFGARLTDPVFLRRAFTHLAIFSAFIGVWEWAGRTGRLNDLIMPAPSAIAEALWRLYFVTGEIYWHFFVTFFEAVMGFLIGGAIGMGLPVATGAAVACPDRAVLSIEADGSSMYTIQSLWTQAREGLDVTTIVLNNRSYAVLDMELQRVGAEAGGPKASAMLDLAEPPIDFCALAQGLGVPAARATTGEELVAHLERAFAEPGPHLIEAVLPSRL